MATNSLTFDNLRAVLEQYGRDAEALYKAKLTQGRPPYGTKNASSDLLNSVKWGLNVDGKSFEVTLNLAHYWKYVEGGSQGRASSPYGAIYRAHWPPSSAILDWINVKPVLPRPDKNGRIPTPKQLAYLIGRKIAMKGIEPFPAMSQTVEELNAKYSEKIAEAVTKDVSAFVPIIFSSFNVRDLANSK